jgi:hypothetical protein
VEAAGERTTNFHSRRRGGVLFWAVPELSRSADVKLNEQVSLQLWVDALALFRRTLPYVRYLPSRSPSGDHIPPGGFNYFLE